MFVVFFVFVVVIGVVVIVINSALASQEHYRSTIGAFQLLLRNGSTPSVSEVSGSFH